jgi:transglutaminase-like putative cysteine protease
VKIIRILAACAVAFGPAMAADPPPKAPAKIVIEQRRIDIAPDASQTTTSRFERQVLSAAAIQPLGQLNIAYSETLQEPSIEEAYTLKADGTKIAVAPSAIITQQRPGSNSLNDQKQKVIVFPNVEVGDTLVSVHTLKTKPMFPGFFAAGFPVPQSVPVDKYEIVFTAPKSLPLYFDAKDLAVERSMDGDKAVYTVRTKVEKPKPMPAPYVSMFDRSPALFVSTMKTWEQFAKLYASLVAPKLAVTPKLQAKADEITAGAGDSREQVNKIYNWVSSHIRYVAIEFGQGGYVPHDPEEVMTNAYGDCKDHAILFATLLKAKGIAADLVVIHASDRYSVPGVPVTGSFNHMINYIPLLGIYADTTQRAMALGYVPRGEYGKTVLHIGSGLRKVPLLAQKDFSYSYKEHQTLDADGKLSATGELTASGVAAGMAHRDGLRLHAAGPEKIATEVLEKRGLSEALGKFDVSSDEAPVSAYKSTTHYVAPKQQAWVGGVPFAMPKGLMVDTLSGEFWLGPLASDKYKKTDILPCYSGTGSEEYTLDLPPGKKLAALPADKKIVVDGLTYISHWSQAGRSVTVKRTLALDFKDMLCRDPQIWALHNALAAIKTDAATTMMLTNE